MSTSYNPKVVTDGLVLALDAGNTKSYPGSGTDWADISGNLNSGSLINAPTFDGGRAGNILFDGTNDYVALSNLNESVWQGNWTVCIFANYTSINNTTNSGLDRPFIQHGIQALRQGLHLTQRSSVIWFGLYGSDINGTTVLTTNRWYHVSFTLNNSTFLKQIYLNGILDNSGFGSAAYTGVGNNTQLGGNPLGFGLTFQGNIANFSVYNRVLSPQEILQNFNATRSRFGV